MRKIILFFCFHLWLLPMVTNGQSFSQVTIAPFNTPKFFSSVIDYNNDGLDDVIGSVGSNFQLWKNNGNSTFTDVTSSMNFPAKGGNICWDIDKNGFTDIYRISGCRLPQISLI